MMETQFAQFESVIENGVIRVPERFIATFPSAVTVTIVHTNAARNRFKPKSKAKPSCIDEFPAVLDTKGWKFDREEANGRR
ncbi:hypothetical protein AGMMS49957_18850 [Synergistales bacterium]|nr:hypothetical protein AGMMS49957_18850 [Synergistales bacterium]